MYHYAINVEQNLTVYVGNMIVTSVWWTINLDEIRYITWHHCSNNMCIIIILIKQESPPASMQEAYRPPCREYSFCCAILADPPLAGPDPPHWLDLAPHWLDLTRPVGWTWPTPPLDWHPPHWLDWSDPPPVGWTWPPPAGLTWPPPTGLTPLLDWPPPRRLDWPDPPPVERQIYGWTDTCQNITFPRTTYAGGNKNMKSMPSWC